MFVRIKTIFAATLLVAASLVAPQARADIYCVNTVEQLIFALDDAGSNGVSDRILLTAGPFQVPNEGLEYSSPLHGESISLEGGYGPQCSTHSNALKSVIDGSDSTYFYALSIQAEASAVTISNLLIRNFTTSNSLAAALAVSGNGIDATLDGNVLFLNRGVTRSALVVTGFEATVRMRDNIIAGNQSTNEVVLIKGVDPTLPMAQCEITNNTFVSNSANLANQNASFQVLDCDHAFIANNVFWNNEGIDLQLADDSSGDYQLVNNDIEEMLFPQNLNLSQDANISTDPGFEPGLLNYLPGPTSPLLDAGIAISPVNQLDFVGKARVSGSRIDMGAIERQVDVFANGFE